MEQTLYAPGSMITLRNYVPPKEKDRIHDNIQYHVRIESIIGKGASCTAYKGITAEGIPVKLKHYLPNGFFSGSAPYNSAAKKFHAAYSYQLRMLHSDMTTNTTAGLFGLFEDENNGYWTAVQATVGRTLDYVMPELNFQTLWQYLYRIAESAKAYHLDNWILMDLKPENVLIVDSLGMEGVSLYDFDSFLHRDDIDHAVQSGAPLRTSSTPGYAAPELISRSFDSRDYGMINSRVDFFSLGAIAFRALFGKHWDPSEDIDAAMDFSYAERHFSMKLSTELINVIRHFLRKTLAAAPENRFCTDDELLQALASVLAYAAPNKPLLRRVLPKATERFLGRKSEVAELSALIEKRISPLFVVGDGGIGKTEIVLKTIESFPETAFYYTVYEKDLRKTLLNLPIDNLPKTKTTPDGRDIPVDELELFEAIMEMLRTTYTADTVLIIDSFDLSDTEVEALERSPEYQQLLCLPVRLIFTSRNRNFHAAVFPVATMTESDLSNMIRVHCPEMKDHAVQKIIEYTCGHTMTVDLVSRCIASPKRLRLSKALRCLKKGYLQAKDGFNVAKSCLFKIFEAMHFTRSERDVLLLSKLFPQRGVDNRLFEVLLHRKELEAAFALSRMGWLKYDELSNTWTVHPIIREFIGHTSDTFISTAKSEQLTSDLVKAEKSPLLVNQPDYERQLSDMLANISRTSSRHFPMKVLLPLMLAVAALSFLFGKGAFRTESDRLNVDVKFFTANTNASQVEEDITAIRRRISFFYPSANYSNLNEAKEYGSGFTLTMPARYFLGKDADEVCASVFISKMDLYCRLTDTSGRALSTLHIPEEYILSASWYTGSESFIFEDVSRTQPLLGIQLTPEGGQYVLNAISPSRISRQKHESGSNAEFLLSTDSDTYQPIGQLIGQNLFAYPDQSSFRFTHWLLSDQYILYLTNIYYKDAEFYAALSDGLSSDKLHSDWLYALGSNDILHQYSWFSQKDFAYSGQYQIEHQPFSNTRYITFRCTAQEEISDELFVIILGRMCRELDRYEEPYAIGYSVLHPREIVIQVPENGKIAESDSSIRLYIPELDAEYRY